MEKDGLVQPTERVARTPPRKKVAVAAATSRRWAALRRAAARPRDAPDIAAGFEAGRPSAPPRPPPRSRLAPERSEAGGIHADGGTSHYQRGNMRAALAKPVDLLTASSSRPLWSSAESPRDSSNRSRCRAKLQAKREGSLACVTNSAVGQGSASGKDALGARSGAVSTQAPTAGNPLSPPPPAVLKLGTAPSSTPCRLASCRR